MRFEPADWETARTVTVEAAEDDDGEHGQEVLEHYVASDDARYDNLFAASVVVTEVDNDPAEPTEPAPVVVPSVSVADARVQEGAGAELAFAVTLSASSSSPVTVDYRTLDGTARAGEDYVAAAGTLSFAAGETAQTVRVAVLDDAHDEGEERLRLLLTNPVGATKGDEAAIGVIENHDPLPHALLSRFGRTAAQHVVEHVEERLQSPREAGFRGRFAGRELRPGMEREMALDFVRQLGGSAGAGGVGAAAVPGPLAGMESAGLGAGGAAGLGGGGTRMGLAAAGPGGGGLAGGGLAGGGLPWFGMFNRRDLLSTSAFELNRATASGGLLSVWSRGAQSSFVGQAGALSLDGEVRTTLLGADYTRGRVAAGLSLSRSRSLGGYRAAASGQVDSSVTGVYPWLGYRLNERVSVWGVTGYGAGTLRLTPAGGKALHGGLSMALAGPARGASWSRPGRASGWRCGPTRCGRHGDRRHRGAGGTSGGGRRGGDPAADRAGGLARLHLRQRAVAEAAGRGGAAARRRRRRDRRGDGRRAAGWRCRTARPACRPRCGCGRCWCTRRPGSGSGGCRCRSATTRRRRPRWG